MRLERIDSCSFLELIAVPLEQAVQVHLGEDDFLWIYDKVEHVLKRSSWYYF